MAHFARVNKDNIVEDVLVVPDEQEHRGEEFLAIDCMLGGRWIQTSYNHRIRKHFAMPGAIYREEVDAFQPPKPEFNPSFIWCEECWTWKPPVDIPADSDWAIGFQENPFEVISEDGEQANFVIPEGAKIYSWDEENVTWKLEGINA